MTNELKSIPCLFCRHEKADFWFVKTTDAGSYNIFKCCSCRSAFVWPRPENEEIDWYYQSDYYNSKVLNNNSTTPDYYYPTSRMDALRIVNVCKRLAGGNEFIDIGAGTGVFSRVAIEKGFNVYACEPNDQSRKLFYELNGFEPQSYYFDEDFADSYPEKFDVALMSQVLEHMIMPDETVKLLHTILKKGGIAAIAVPQFGSLLSRIQGRRDMYISPPEHLNFFSIKGLVSLFERHNLKIEFLETVSKVPIGKFKNLLKVKVLGLLSGKAVYGALHLFDFISRGMVINAYFKKL